MGTSNSKAYKPAAAYGRVNSSIPPDQHDGNNNLLPKERYAGWLPESPMIYNKFLGELAQLTYSRQGPHVPAVEKFRQAIVANSTMHDLFQQIFPQAPVQNRIRDFDHLLYELDAIVERPPKFHITVDDHGNLIGESIGVPMYLLFDLLSNTAAAYDLFRMQAFNVALKDLLESWGNYLKSNQSNITLTTGPEGWFGQLGISALQQYRGVFNLTYVCPDLKADNRGFTSWDAFFTRKFITQPDPVRPIATPDDDRFIHSACESTVVRIADNVQLHDRFWLKDQPYSLYDMLNRDVGMADQFKKGTVYQAFLRSVDYHRWHSPVNGVIKKACLVPGTYYAALPDAGTPGVGDQGLEPDVPYSGALVRSQPYLTMSATRALIYIQSNNPAIGLMCFIAVGMGEVSTCELSVNPGDPVNIGDELGMFHFGGSSYALVFREEAKVEFDFPEWPGKLPTPDLPPQEAPRNLPGQNPHIGKHIWVNSIIGHSKA